MNIYLEVTYQVFYYVAWILSSSGDPNRDFLTTCLITRSILALQVITGWQWTVHSNIYKVLNYLWE